MGHLGVATPPPPPQERRHRHPPIDSFLTSDAPPVRKLYIKRMQ